MPSFSPGLCGIGLLELALILAVSAAIRADRMTGRYRWLVDHSGDAIVRLDRSLAHRRVSPGMTAMLGHSGPDLLRRPFGALVHPQDWAAVADRLAAGASGRVAWIDATCRMRHRDGHELWVDARFRFAGADGGIVATLRDVTERVEALHRLTAANDRLVHMASHDSLTGLANRRRFDEILDVECRRAAREETPLSLLLLDVDRFKRFNDCFGHPAGDDCLRRIAGVIGAAKQRPADLAARYGGEEFVILLPVTDAAGAANVAERVRAAIEALAVGHAANASGGGVVTASIGCATVFPQARNPAAAAVDLIADADRMLYEAKRRGRNRVIADLRDQPAALSKAREDQRLRTLARYRSAADAAASELERIARLASRLLGTERAFVSLVERDAVTIVAGDGSDGPSIPREQAFCAEVLSGDEPLVVPDARADPRFAANPLVLAADGVRFYAGAPLLSPIDGACIGTLCVLDRQPRVRMSIGKHGILLDLANLVMEQLEQRRLADASDLVPGTP